MKSATIIICESATPNVDGSFEITRAGITFHETPLGEKFGVVLFMRFPPLPTGKYSASIQVTSPWSDDSMPGTYTAVGAETGFMRAGIEILPTSYGIVNFKVTVDGPNGEKIEGEERLIVRPPKSAAKPN